MKVRGGIVVVLWVKVHSRKVVSLRVVKVPSHSVVEARVCNEAQFKTGTYCTTVGFRNITDTDVGSMTLRDLFDDG